MTRYTDLSTKAVRHVQEFLEQEANCTKLAYHVLSNVKRYLEAPDEAVTFIGLDNDLRPKWGPTVTSPVMIRGQDDRRYFGLLVHFEVPGQRTFSEVVITFGLSCSGNACTVKLNGEHTIVPSDANTWAPMLTELVNALDRQYSSAQGQTQRPMGFIQTRT